MWIIYNKNTCTNMKYKIDISLTSYDSTFQITFNDYDVLKVKADINIEKATKFVDYLLTKDYAYKDNIQLIFDEWDKNW